MDPAACLRRLLAAAAAYYDVKGKNGAQAAAHCLAAEREYADALDDLHAWTTRGGFVPRVDIIKRDDVDGALRNGGVAVFAV